MILSYFIIIISAAAGFAITFYIYYKQRRREKLICPLGADCEAVVNSDFASFLGIPNTLLGMIYYGATALIYSILAVSLPLQPSAYLTLLLVAMALAAFLFSIYLTFIQIFVIKQWCSWCLASFLLSAAIFFASLNFLAFVDFTLVVDVLSNYRKLFLILHNIGIALGIGGVTITDVLFLRFLKDSQISKQEAGILKKMSQIIWLALGILIVSGLALYLPEMDELNNAGWFLAKLIIVSVIIINGAFLNLYISPNLMRVFSGAEGKQANKKIKILRRLAFVMGGISITSWYSVLVIGILHSLPLTFTLIVSVYILVVGTAAGAGWLMGKRG